MYSIHKTNETTQKTKKKKTTTKIEKKNQKLFTCSSELMIQQSNTHPPYKMRSYFPFDKIHGFEFHLFIFVINHNPYPRACGFKKSQNLLHFILFYMNFVKIAPPPHVLMRGISSESVGSILWMNLMQDKYEPEFSEQILTICYRIKLRCKSKYDGTVVYGGSWRTPTSWGKKNAGIFFICRNFKHMHRSRVFMVPFMG